jgi:hypothetical protein
MVSKKAGPDNNLIAFTGAKYELLHHRSNPPFTVRKVVDRVVQEEMEKPAPQLSASYKVEGMGDSLGLILTWEAS